MSRDDENAWENLPRDMQRAFDKAAREIHASYYAAENSRYLPSPPGINPMGSGADYHYRTESQYLRMVERARFFDRDNMVVGQGVTRLIDNVLMDGPTLDPDTGDVELDNDLREMWAEWANDPAQCDDAGERTWHEFEQLSLRHVIVDGDIVALPLSSGSLQWFEGHSLRNPYGSSNGSRLIHGVELGDNRRRSAYWLTPDEISPMASPSKTNKFARVPAFDASTGARVLHLYQPKRLSQTRGVTAFAPSVVPIQYHEDLEFATLLKAKAAAFVAIFREYAADAPGGGSLRRGGSRTTETQDDGTSRVIEKSGLAQTVKGDPGEKLTGFAPNIPNPEFFPHASLILTFVSINLGLPLQVFLLDPTKGSFSAWRGAIDQARQGMRRIQRWQISRLHKPVYGWKVAQWATRDPAIRGAAERGGVDIYRHTWKPPRWPYIEPLTDAQADSFRVAKNLAPARTVAAERGYDYDDMLVDVVGDRVQLIELACQKTDELNRRYPWAKVDWREVAFGRESDSTAATVAQITADATSDSTQDSADEKA